MINRISVLAVLVIVLVIYSVVLFMTADLSKGVLWLGYGFTIISAAVCGVVNWFTLKDPMDAEELYYQIPVSAICAIYVAVAMVLGIVAACLPGTALKGMAIAEMIIHAIFWIVLLMSLMHMRKILQMQGDKADKVANIRLWESRLLAMAQDSKDSALKERIKRLAEDIRFSDPMSNESVEHLDRELYEGICELQEMVESDDTTQAMLQVEKLSVQLKNRNREARIAHS